MRAMLTHQTNGDSHSFEESDLPQIRIPAVTLAQQSLVPDGTKLRFPLGNRPGELLYAAAVEVIHGVLLPLPADRLNGYLSITADLDGNALNGYQGRSACSVAGATKIRRGHDD